MRAAYPVTVTYRRVAMLHNLLTLLWLALPGIVATLAVFELWLWVVVCLPLNLGLAAARRYVLRCVRPTSRNVSGAQTRPAR